MSFYPYTVEAVNAVFNATNNGTNAWLSDEGKRWIGISLALIANTITAASFNVQRYAHMKNERLALERRIQYLRNPLWWAGFILLVVGETGNFMAYSFAPASLIAPLGAWSVVMNALIGKCLKFLGETFRPRDIIGYVFTIAGGLLIIFFSPKDDREITTEDFMGFISDTFFIVYFCCLTVGIIAMVIAGFKWGKKYMLIYLLVTSMLGSVTIMSTKGFATFFVQFVGGNMSVLASPLTWILLVVLVVTALVQVQYLNMVMQQFGTAQVMPIFFVMWNFWCIAGTIILYQEFSYLTQEIYIGILFVLGVIVTSVGVYFVAGGVHDKKKQTVPTTVIAGTSDTDTNSNEGADNDGEHDNNNNNNNGDADNGENNTTSGTSSNNAGKSAKLKTQAITVDAQIAQSESDRFGSKGPEIVVDGEDDNFAHFPDDDAEGDGDLEAQGGRKTLLRR